MCSISGSLPYSSIGSIGRPFSTSRKLQCLRLLATLRLDPARSALISRFVDSYLDLRAKEVRIWQRQGRLEGRLEGLRSGLASGLRALFGERALALIERIQSYELGELQKLERRFVLGARLEDLEAS